MFLVKNANLAKFKGTYSLREVKRNGLHEGDIFAFTVYSDGISGSGAWPVADTATSAAVENILAQWSELIAALGGKGYNLMSSCNKDASAYLVPEGAELSYYGHPEGTYRLSDHWSWYSSEKRCTELERVQCPLRGVSSWPRKAEGVPTTPKIAICIAKMVNGEYIPVTKVIK